MSQVRLRLAAASDCEAIAGVHRTSRASYYGTRPDADDHRAQMWAELLPEPGRVTYVAESSGRVVGFVSALRHPDPVAALEMTALYVLPEHIGSGVGSMLHGAFDSQRGPGEVGVLEVWEENSRAVEFFVGHVWVATARTRRGPRDVDHVTYELRR